jgi:hypothetical protein
MNFRLVVANYYAAASSVSRSMHVSYLSAWKKILAARLLEGIGPFHFCLFCMDGVPPERWEHYLTNTELDRAQRRWNPEPFRELVRNKARFFQRCTESGLPTPPVLGIVGDQACLFADVPVIDCADALACVLQNHAGPDFFFKLGRGAHGDGALVVRRVGTKYDFDGRCGTADDLFRHVRHITPPRDCYLIQPCLRNHPALASIMSPNGLGTVRIVTQIKEHGVTHLSAVLRMTVGSSVTDNFRAGMAGNIQAPIDLDTGTLGRAAGSARRDWPEMHTVQRHPDTGAVIAGLELPLWQDVKQLTVRAQTSFPELRCLGWDVAVTEQGPVLVEANHAWDINLLQMAHRKGLRPEMGAALGSFDAFPGATMPAPDHRYHTGGGPSST